MSSRLACVAALAMATLPWAVMADTVMGFLVDAGSSGSRVNVYSWDDRVFPSVPRSLSVPVFLEYQTNRTAPGIDKPAGLVALQQLLQGVAQQYAALASRFNTFPVFLTATAGMRVLDVATRTAIMGQVRAILAATPFLFQPEWAQVISGEQEGVYGWLSVNYVMGTLLSATAPPTLSNFTYGALDLGGASTQITFIPPGGVDIMANKYEVDVTDTLAASVYTHSFLYYGQNEAMARVHELQLAAALANGTSVVNGAVIPHPCYFVGTPLSRTTYTSYSTVPGVTVQFAGTSNATACAALATVLMQKSTICLTDPKPVVTVSASGPVAATSHLSLPPAPVINANASGSTCSLNGVYQPPTLPPSGSAATAQPIIFYAFSSFTYLWEFLRLPYQGVPLSDFTANVTAVCDMTFAQVNATYGNAVNAPFLQNYCNLGTFVSVLWTVGYGIPSNGSYVAVAPSTMSLSYATGAMLYNVNNLAWTLRNQGDDGAQLRVLQIGLGVPLAVATLVACASVCWCTWCRKGGSGLRWLGGRAGRLNTDANDGYVVHVSPTVSSRSSMSNAAIVPDWAGAGTSMG